MAGACFIFSAIKQGGHESQKVRMGNTALHTPSHPPQGEYFSTDLIAGTVSVNKSLF